VLDKLGIKSHERLSPKHIALIQKRVLSEHGGIPFGVVDTDETGQASFTYNADEANLTPGLTSSFKNDLNQRHPEMQGQRITYHDARTKGTPIGTTKPSNKILGIQYDLVFGPLPGTPYHLGWSRLGGSPKWVQELAKTQGKFYE
jgi:hypothetical protein